MYRTYSVNNMPEPVRYSNIPPPKCEEKPVKNGSAKSSQIQKCEKNGGGLFSNVGSDDIILGVIIIALLMDDCSDKVLLAALTFILFADCFDF